MSSKNTLSKLTLLTLMGIVGCRSQANLSSSSSDSKLDAQSNASETVFNFASYIRQSPLGSPFRKYVQAGDEYLFFGDKNRFQVQTNISANASGKIGLIAGKSGISSRFWIDSFVFGKKLGSDSRGYVLDAGVDTGFDKGGFEAYYRFLGDDKFRKKVTGAIDQTFMRDLEVEPTVYPMPMLGLKVGGNIGGEMGVKANQAIQEADTLTLGFRPLARLTAGLAAGIEVLKFSEAKAVGQVGLIDLKVASNSSVGRVSSPDFVYGNSSFDGGSFSAMDGEVFVLAKAGLKGILPAGLDNKLWEFISEKLSIDAKQWEWRHTVWKPDAIFEQDLPRFGSIFKTFMTKPKNVADCEAKQKEIVTVLDQHLKRLEVQPSGLDVIEKTAHGATVYFLNILRTDIESICKKI